MERRKAVTAAAAAGLTMLAGAAGIALNSGIVGAKDDGNVGQLSPLVEARPQVDVRDASGRPLVSSPAVDATDGAPVATSSASGHDSDDDEHDDDDEQVDHRDDKQEGHDQYEGADDDD